MVQQVRQLSSQDGARAFALALAAAALVALAGVGGYEIGTASGQAGHSPAPAPAAQPATGQQDAPSIDGLQP